MTKSFINYKEQFLKRMFLYNIQYLVAAGICLGVLVLWIMFLIYVCDVSDELGVSFIASSPFLCFGFYNLFAYIYSKKLAEKYGIDMFGDLDQDWLIEYQGYDAKVFGEIYSKLLYFRKLGAQSLFITIPVSFTPWPAVPLIVGIIMIVFYILYKQVYFYQAMGDMWPRVFAGGFVISRIINGEKGKSDTNGDRHGK